MALKGAIISASCRYVFRVNSDSLLLSIEEREGEDPKLQCWFALWCERAKNNPSPLNPLPLKKGEEG